ncbi:MAG: Clp protease N-terminal domain-containing protein, partial [Hyphomicrobium sp.]
MTNMVVAELGRIPMSANLAATLSRATDYARAQQHLEVTLEHLLLALIEDPEAGLVLTASNIDASRLSADVSGHLGRIEERAPPDRQGQLVVSSDLRRILEAAAAAAQQGRRREINGAIVLAAVVGDGRSTAAHLLSAHGLTFEGAIHALQRANAQAASPTASPIANQPGAVPQSQPPQPPSQPQPPARVADTATAPQNLPAPQPPSMDDLLAEARERVRKRHAPGGSAEVQHAPAELAAPEPEPTASPEASVAETYVPDWREPAAPAVPPEPRIEPTFPPMVAQPAPLPLPGPPAAGEMPSFGASSPHPPQVPQRPDQQRPASPPPGSPLPPRPGVHPHRPMPPDRGARQPQPPVPALPPPSMPAGAANGSWAPSPPHMPSGPPTGPRPMRQPPPLPPGVPPPAARGRQMPTSDEMAHELRRVQPAQLQPHMHGPVAGPMPGPLSAPATAGPLQSAPTGRPRAGGASASVEIGQLVENIPKVMRVAVPQRVEVRIGKANVKALAEGLQGGGAAFRHEVMVTKAMCVRLRAPEGGFYIESASPETQWIESTLGLMSDDHASWRWTVTPRARGWKRLQLVVSARTVGSDGLAAETALPDQVIDVKVRTNYGKAAATASAWVAAAIAGGLLAKFGEGAF